ncbi:MAG: ABC transporter ATP-binding protein [Chloroflexi bacterium]|nr:ABC transporter ATP-binding protein [Chloroflexota bacterium]MCL5074479.1 ABC transporter ATP-binding protein [Chloroflexota bacterium]
MIRTQALTKQYGSLTAVSELDLHVRQGEIYGFLGPNGAGKTTTILMLLGIVQPTSGQVYLFSEELQKDYFSIKRRLGVMGERQYLYDDVTAHEYLSLFAELYEVKEKETKIAILLEALDLYDYRNILARDYSRGMQQKLGLARALLHDPDLLILDEPVSGLDPHGIKEVRELIQEENRRGKTIFISSHILSEIEKTADRVGIINHGKLVAQDSMENIRRKLRRDIELEIELEMSSPEIASALRSLPFVKEVVGQDNKLAVRSEETEDFRPQIFQSIASRGGVILDMRTKEMTLEDAFITITDQNISLLTG